jgi:hypothetical protein
MNSLQDLYAQLLVRIEDYRQQNYKLPTHVLLHPWTLELFAPGQLAKLKLMVQTSTNPI